MGMATLRSRYALARLGRTNCNLDRDALFGALHLFLQARTTEFIGHLGKMSLTKKRCVLFMIRLSV